MVDNLKSCNLQGTATDTDTHANECRSHYGTLLLLLLLLLWTFLLSRLCDQHNHNSNNTQCLLRSLLCWNAAATATITTSQASLKAWSGQAQAGTPDQDQDPGPWPMSLR